MPSGWPPGAERGTTGGGIAGGRRDLASDGELVENMRRQMAEQMRRVDQRVGDLEALLAKSVAEEARLKAELSKRDAEISAQAATLVTAQAATRAATDALKDEQCKTLQLQALRGVMEEDLRAARDLAGVSEGGPGAAGKGGGAAGGGDENGEPDVHEVLRENARLQAQVDIYKNFAMTSLKGQPAAQGGPTPLPTSVAVEDAACRLVAMVEDMRRLVVALVEDAAAPKSLVFLPPSPRGGPPPGQGLAPDVQAEAAALVQAVEGIQKELATLRANSVAASAGPDRAGSQPPAQPLQELGQVRPPPPSGGENQDPRTPSKAPSEKEAEREKKQQKMFQRKLAAMQLKARQERKEEAALLRVRVQELEEALRAREEAGHQLRQAAEEAAQLGRQLRDERLLRKESDRAARHAAKERDRMAAAMRQVREKAREELKALATQQKNVAADEVYRAACQQYEEELEALRARDAVLVSERGERTRAVRELQGVTRRQQATILGLQEKIAQMYNELGAKPNPWRVLQGPHTLDPPPFLQVPHSSGKDLQTVAERESIAIPGRYKNNESIQGAAQFAGHDDVSPTAQVFKASQVMRQRVRQLFDDLGEGGSEK
eukprot:jgi/Mesvir1/28426/Mv15853-RA.1